MLEEELIKLGANVILTRDGDYDLSSPNTTWRKKSDFDNRIDLINNSGSDLYISIHLNYLNDSTYYGPQVFYNEDNFDLALIIQEELNDFTNTNREVKIISDSTYMYKNLTIPGVLIECGFMSNKEELDNLTNEDYQEKLANTIAISIVEFF